MQTNFIHYTKQLLSQCLPVKFQYFHTMDSDFFISTEHSDFVPMLIKYLLPEMKQYNDVCESSSICCITTPFQTKYYILCLSREEGKHISIGPFLESPVTDTHLYSIISSRNLSLEFTSKLRLYYQSVSTLDPDSIYQILCTIYGFLKNTEELPKQITLDLRHIEKSLTSYGLQLEEMNRNTMYKLIEERYANESKLLSFIEKGDVLQAQAFWNKSSFASLQISRTKDTIRNAKNLMLVANTLFRKAAHNGGVHPVYIDELSGKWAIKIEQAASVEALLDMSLQIVRSYCLLVKNQTLSQYSPIVQRTLTYIHLNLSAPLTVSRIAGEMGLSPDYLTRLCKKEVGCSLITYINRKRIQASLKLLNMTEMTIEEIGELVGFSNSSYYYTVFKREIGVSPKKYRDRLKKTFK